ncbi:MAG: type IV pilus assembly protein PilM [Planctomycetaceae bacterium]
MAELPAAWGIEIGQAGLKAIRLRYVEAADQVMAIAFDYVPHPKLLSQPDAVPEELIRQALDTFLSRNQVGTDLVAISLPGRDALAKFIQLPPVESSKVAEIVKYEARQQIPFPLEEVYWDYQTLGGGSEEGGFLLDAEVGLIAMKREQVNHHLQPYLERKIEVEVIQIAPLALYNFLCFERMGMRPGDGGQTPEDYSVLLDMGADNTTLMITNGRKIWIRNVPIGGNHFSRALTKEMKLTFAKAEHLKCNATKSPDPRAVFQALRPVFNDYVSEIQRSIGYFASVNRQAKIGRLVGVGNGFKLAGLQKFLQQNLQYEVERIDSFQAIVGDNVLNSPLFQDNILTFAVPYGLALQLLKRTTIRTSLLPTEISTARRIRRKKPWAAATAAALLFGLATSAALHGQALQSVSETRFGEVEKKAKDIDEYAKKLDKNYKAQVAANEALREQGQKLVSALDTRELWLEVYKAIDECLPRDIAKQQDIEDIRLQNRISLKTITTKRYEDLDTWYNEKIANSDGPKGYLLASEKETGPSGPGYVFTLQGVHHHEEKDNTQTGWGIPYVIATLLHNLQQWEVRHEDQDFATPVRKLGITHATITEDPNPDQILYAPNSQVTTTGGSPLGAARPMVGNGSALRKGGRGRDADILSPPPGQLPVGRPNVTLPKAEEQEGITIPEQTFTIEFAWKPTPVAERTEEDPLAPKQDAGDADSTEKTEN